MPESSESPESPAHHVELATAADRFLPHADTAHLIREVIESDADSMLCIARFPADSALLRNGMAASHLLVEASAQAAATHMAILAVEAGEQSHGFEGFLTSAKNVKTPRPHVPAETDITIRVRPRGAIRRSKAGLYKHFFEAHLDGDLIASGELSAYVTPVD